MTILLLPLLLTMPLCDELRAELQLAVEAEYITEHAAEAISNRCVEPPNNSYETFKTPEASLES